MQLYAAEFAKLFSGKDEIIGFSNHFRFFLLKRPTTYYINGHKITCNSDQMLYCTPGTDFRIEPVGEFGLLDYIDFMLDESERSRLFSLPIAVNEASAPPNFSELSGVVKCLYYLFYSADRYRQEKIELYFWNLVYATASGDESAQDLVGMSLLHHQMCQLRKQISDDPQSFENVNQAAAFVGISVSRFQHLYREYFNISFVQDQIRSKIKHARMLLNSTDWTVNHIARELGYDNEALFYRQFRQQVGASPAEYRKMDIQVF